MKDIMTYTLGMMLSLVQELIKVLYSGLIYT